MPGDNQYMARYMADRYLLLKLKAVEYKGGKCCKCGYNKCYAALEFHHRDPLDKEMHWNYLKRKKWSTIVIELDKCDLLCANCHRETHLDDNLLEQVKSRIRSQKETPPKTASCKYCHKDFQYTTLRVRKYCSRQCTILDREKINWPENLVELVSQSSKSAVAKKLGVSDKAVAKRLKMHFGFVA